MTTISATSIAASRHSLSGDTLHTLLLCYPLWLHDQLMAYRAFSRTLPASEPSVETVVNDRSAKAGGFVTQAAKAA